MIKFDPRNAYKVEITAPSGFPKLHIGELIQYRYMVYLLTKRQITAVYRQSILGPSWIILNSITSMIINTFVFNMIADINSGEIPYPLFNYAALVIWTLFAGTLTGVTSSVSYQPMIKKI